MTPDQWDKVQELLADLCAADPVQRKRLLDEAASNHSPEIIREVQSLLEYDEPVLPQTVHVKAPGPFTQVPQLARFKILRSLGSGSFGHVYEAYDHDVGMHVALKVLRQTDPQRLLRFKHEFRALSRINHANLVKLYHLVGGDSWLFTMQMIDGIDFHSYCRKSESGVLDLNRALPALRQLAEGITELHRHDLLHRDIKPGNVLVTPAGRVVLLDFGLVKELADQGTQQTIAGTPEFMAPEQFSNSPISRAADWYAFGVMLFQTLTGKVPFTGGFYEQRDKKHSGAAALPDDQTAAVPAELKQLCEGLLATRPEDRPSGSDVRECLLRLSGQHLPESPQRDDSGIKTELVGREHHLSELERMFRDSRRGRFVAVDVVGKAGMGKTALIQAALKRIVQHSPETKIFTAYCTENESVPFQALDGLVDGLSAYLRGMPDSFWATTRPAGFQALCELFPVISARNAPSSLTTEVIRDPHELRTRAFQSLLELLARAAEYRPVIVCIHHLQWGDLDSTPFFRLLFTSPSPPPLLLVTSYRSEDKESPFLKAHRSLAESRSGDIAIYEIEVDELSAGDTLLLAKRCLEGRSAEEIGSLASGAARECGGCPVLIELYLKHAASGESRLSEVIERVLQRAGNDAAGLLQLLAVAGQPVPTNLLLHAAGGGETGYPALSSLVDQHFVQMQDYSGMRRAGISHPLVTQAVLACIPSSNLQAVHLRLAEAGEAMSPPDHAFIASQFLLAGDRAKFAEHQTLAAEHAVKSYSFEQAAELYRQLLDEGAIGSPADRFELKRKLAEALGSANRGKDSAEAFEQCAQFAPTPHEAVNMKLLAAQAWIRFGHLAHGLALLRSVAASAGIRVPDRPWKILLEWPFWRCAVKLSPKTFVPCPVSDIDARTRIRLDIYRTLAGGYLSGASLSILFREQYHLLARKSGHSDHYAIALALDAGMTVFSGESGYSKSRTLLQSATALATRSASSNVRGIIATMEAVSDVLTGRWQTGTEHALRAERLLLECAGGGGWDLTTARVFQLGGLTWSGSWREQSSRLNSFLRDAFDRGDLYATTHLQLSSFSSCPYLSRGRPQEAEKVLRDALQQWESEEFDVPRFWGNYGLVETMLYRSDGVRSWNHLQEIWRQMAWGLRTSLNCQYLRIMAFQIRAKCLLAYAKQTSSREQMPELRRCIAGVHKSGATWSKGMASLLEAAAQTLQGNRAAALQLAAKAETQLEFSDMKMCAAAARYRHGKLLGGDEGELLVREATDFIKAQGMEDPASIVEMLAPGF